MHEHLIRTIREKVNLTDEEASSFARFFIPKRYRKRQCIRNAGDKCQYLVFVAKGLLRSFTVHDDGSEHVMQLAMEGAWITDMGSFLSGEDAIYNIEALEDAELLLLTKQSMDEMIETIANIERYFRLLMQNSIIALQRRISLTLAHSAEEAYLKMMELQPEIVNRASQQHLASYLGINPATLSRIRKQLAVKGNEPGLVG